MAWKKHLRIGATNLRNQLRYLSPTYAQQQNLDLAHQYPELWHSTITRIPDRGTSEIRANRIANLRQGIKKIDGLLIHPGQKFSFSYRVGHPSVNNGFQAGPVFVGGKVQTGVGGGLCLLATNLFQLFLYSGCQIVERHCHSIDAYGAERFYGLGEDAAVAYGYKDLIIANASSIELWLRLNVKVEEGIVESQLWGKTPCPWAVRVESTVLGKIPGPAPNWLPGYRVETQRYTQLLDKNSLNPPEWRCDYQTLSIYKPCPDSRPVPSTPVLS